MLKKALCLSVYFFNQFVFCQDKLNIGIQLNPVFNYNDFKVSDKSLGKMSLFSIGSEIGFHINKPINNRLSFTTCFQYFTQSQKVEQKEFFGYLDAGSKTWCKYVYENKIFEGFLNYNINKKVKNNINLIVGLGYSFVHHSSSNYGYHYEFYGKPLNSIGYNYSPTPIASGIKYNEWKPIIGFNHLIETSKIGRIAYGVLLHIPTKQMTKINYTQILETADKGDLITSVSYTSKQYPIELSIIYYILNFDKKFKKIKYRK